MGRVASGKYVYKPGDHKHLHTWRTCAYCGAEYLGRVDSNSRFCSRRCAGKANGKQPRPAASCEGYLVCTKCGEEKPEDDFAQHSQSASGRKPRCRECTAEAWQEIKTPEILERMRETAAKRREADPEAFRLRRTEDMRTWRAANPDRARENERRWREANRSRRLHSEHTRRARKARTQIADLTPDLVAAKWAYWGGLCWICRSTPAREWDHVKPLNKGGSHILANLRPACARCNRRKRDRWPFKP